MSSGRLIHMEYVSFLRAIARLVEAPQNTAVAGAWFPGVDQSGRVDTDPLSTLPRQMASICHSGRSARHVRCLSQSRLNAIAAFAFQKSFRIAANWRGITQPIGGRQCLPLDL